MDADWSRRWPEPRRGGKWNAARQHLPPEQRLQLRAAYWAQINHLDDQIQRVLEAIDRGAGLDNTLVLFTSDHGEMLGDHQWMRKRVPWEPSARVPLLLRPPAAWGSAGGRVREELVGLQDVMPTLLDAAGVAPPEGTDGQPLLPLLRDDADAAGWRDVLHGECSDVGGGFDRPTGMQYLATSPGGSFDRRWKYAWFPGLGREQLFDLDADPAERHDLSADAAHADALGQLRGELVRRLDGRPEGFVRDGGLATLGGTTASHFPAFKRPTG